MANVRLGFAQIFGDIFAIPPEERDADERKRDIYARAETRGLLECQELRGRRVLEGSCEQMEDHVWRQLTLSPILVR